MNNAKERLRKVLQEIREEDEKIDALILKVKMEIYSCNGSLSTGKFDLRKLNEDLLNERRNCNR